MAKKIKLKQPSVRVARKREQARGEILDAAHDLLNRKGVDAVTLVLVAGELGMTKQALYHYFASKEALLRSLVTRLLDDEVDTLIAAVEAEKDPNKTLGVLIRAFYSHYVHRLDAFRIIYSQSQLYSGADPGMSPDSIREEINPRTRQLFDVLETCLAQDGTTRKPRRQLRRLAFTAWTSVLGLLTMLSVADAVDDPLAHSDKALLDTLVDVFEGSLES